MPVTSLRENVEAAHRTFADRLAVLERRTEPGPADPRRYRATGKSLSRDLVRHVEAVERVLLPAATEAGGDVRDLAEQQRPQLRHIESLLKRLDTLHDVKALDETVTALIATLHEHAEVTEHRLIPALERVISAESADQLATDFASASESAPTRPHPWMPDSPPWNRAAAHVTRRVDAARDATDAL
jgi:hypothetical protein